MPSKKYRYFCLDRTGQLHGAQWIAAASDEEVIAQVQAKHPGGRCEIWDGQFLVAQLGFPAKDQAIRTSYQTINDARSLLRETAGMVPRDPRRDSSGDAR